MLLRFVMLAGSASLLGMLLLPFGEEIPEQPIAYSHRVHIDAGMSCSDCHTTVETHDRAQLPSVSKCMLCHQAIAVDHPEVQRLAAYSEKGLDVPWVRVYGFEKRGHVIFRHAPHVRAGVECARCHGDVAEMSVAERAVEHTMGTCVECHRESGASDDCAICHF